MPPPFIQPLEYDWICRFLLKRIGQDLGPGKEYLVESRLGPLLQKMELAGYPDLILRLQERPYSQVTDLVLEAMAIQETSFFRGANTFSALKDIILPDLIQSKQKSKTLKIWSACCATGQEPYSIALMLKEHFPDISNRRVYLLATDFSHHALEKARSGQYSKMETVRGLPMGMRENHFRENPPGQFTLEEPLRAMVQFKKLNLLDPFFNLDGPFDLILIRNVMIYMPLPLARETLGKMRREITDDGYLILGDSETILGKTNHFALHPEGLNYFRPLNIE